MRRLLRIARDPFAVPLLARGWQRAVPILLAIGTICVLGGLAVIWAARLTVPYPVYVSELGAAGAPTARPFAAALVLIAIGGSPSPSRAVTSARRPGCSTGGRRL